RRAPPLRHTRRQLRPAVPGRSCRAGLAAGARSASSGASKQNPSERHTTSSAICKRAGTHVAYTTRAARSVKTRETTRTYELSAMKREDEAAAAEHASPPKSASPLSVLAALIVSLGEIGRAHV